MAGKFKGVHSCNLKKYPMAHYTNCSSHCLNLAIAKASTIVLGNTFSNLSSIVSFFHEYPICEERIRCAIQAVVPQSNGQRLESLSDRIG